MCVFFLAAFNDCQTRESCGDCISSSPDCSWCEDIVRLILMLSIQLYKKLKMQLTLTHQYCYA